MLVVRTNGRRLQLSAVRGRTGGLNAEVGSPDHVEAVIFVVLIDGFDFTGSAGVYDPFDSDLILVDYHLAFHAEGHELLGQSVLCGLEHLGGALALWLGRLSYLGLVDAAGVRQLLVAAK